VNPEQRREAVLAAPEQPEVLRELARRAGQASQGSVLAWDQYTEWDDHDVPGQWEEVDTPDYGIT
jgi:hypothetical protein